MCVSAHEAGFFRILITMDHLSRARCQYPQQDRGIYTGCRFTWRQRGNKDHKSQQAPQSVPTEPHPAYHGATVTGVPMCIIP